MDTTKENLRTLHVQIPESVYDALKRQAQANNRTKRGEVIHTLKQVLNLNTTEPPQPATR